ncbi:ArsI/CadI family heavy metal resistance metalloenzyme [Adhaeribacter rhizoryzae]|uniref:Glyoxalase/bleomycin resistance/dioxygenase family protein n=1 Tax=Adhaeribacter rhizoryzae TaxID=2607907 RepID=A0A5M6DGR0_9BACT|nr:ArsI/CadI family heavy metal resistance metalloenzyme [Adhaeribacter rhizoryzae]KAA5546737.1 glyoxalase/bleomycin resistance/dioxygenase family protein [Adhaeribacter rhizoryzae]
MKRLHVHVRVKNLDESVAFYNALFAASPTVLKPDYAKWLLEDPRVNFAISLRSDKIGLEHLGIQAESSEELNEVYNRLEQAKGAIREEGQTTCCYAQSEKSWITDPQGIDWEAFYTFGSSTTYTEAKAPANSACCEPTCCEK